VVRRWEEDDSLPVLIISVLKMLKFEVFLGAGNDVEEASGKRKYRSLTFMFHDS